MPYFFASSISESQVTIAGADARHLAGPLRARVGEVIAVLDPARGLLLSVSLTSVSASVVSGAVVATAPHSPEPALSVCMCLALLPAASLEESLSRCTELGAESFLLISAARSVARAAGSGSASAAARRSARWETVCREAAMLAGRFRVPAVEGPVQFAEALGRFADDPVFVLERGARESLSSSLISSLPMLSGLSSAGGVPRRVALFVGPEGGWSEEELARAGGRLRGLGPRNLRAPNAAAAALAVVLAAGEDL